MHSSRICTACSSSHHGGSPHPPGSRPPWSRHPPREQTPPEQATPWSRHPPCVSLETTPGQIHLNFPLGCGSGDPPWPDPPQLPPWLWAWRPPLARFPSTSPLIVGLETPPWPDASQLPPGCGTEKLQGMLGYQSPPGDLLQGMLGYHLQCMLG